MSKKNILLKIFIPIVIGLGVIIVMFCDEYKPGTWSQINFTPTLILGIVLAWIFMVGRDFGLMWRFRIMTDRRLTWWQALRVTMMCEFASAMTPSSVGGSAVGMIFLNREGVEMGRATTLMLSTIFLDELLFVIICPIALFLFPIYELFRNFNMWGLNLQWLCWIIYGAIALWTLLLYWGIFVKPQVIRNIIVSVFRWRILRRWLDKITIVADNIVKTSSDIGVKPLNWWIKAFCATITSWMSRFMVVNALLLAFTPLGNQILILCRQFVLWLVLMVCPTPGGSGVSEELFINYYSDVFSSNIVDALSVAIIIALFWRIITYYVYLLVGIFMLPSFLSATRKNNNN